MSADHDAWADLLDAFEERLRRQEAALRGGTAPPDGMELPAPDHPLPPELRSRALALLDRSWALEAKVGREVARRRPQGQAYGRAGHDLGSL